MKVYISHGYLTGRKYSGALKFLTFVMMMVAIYGFGQELRGQGGAPTRPVRSMNYGNWVGRKVMTKEFIDKVGINDEQAANLKAAMEKIEKKLKEVDSEISKLSIEQARLAKKILNEPGADATEIMEIIEKIGVLRTEQAKANTQILISIRDTLTEDQRKIANETIAEEGHRRMIERRMRRQQRAERGEHGQLEPNAPARPAVPKGW
jgi:hypothetical protein